MTYYKDWELVNDEALIRGITASLSKRAQQVQTQQQQQATQASILSVARKMAHNLVRAATGQPPAANITATPPQGSDVSLKADNINNLDNLLAYMHTNRIAVDNDQVVYTAQDLGSTDEEINQKVDSMGLAELDGKTTRDDQRGQPTQPGKPGAPPGRKWELQKYFFKQELLVRYVQYLRQRAEEMKKQPENTAARSTGQMLYVYVGKIISDLQTRRKINIPTPPRSVPGQPTELPDETILDSWTEKIFNAKAPGRYEGPNAQYHLYAKDLKSAETLNAWLQGSGDQAGFGSSGKVAQISSYDEQNNRKPAADYRDNPCIVIQVLVARSTQTYPTTEAGRKAAAYYQAQIKSIGTQFTGPDGQACTLSATQSTQQGQGQGQGGQGGISQNEQTILNHLLDPAALPLRINDIDFSRIKTFQNLYSQLIPAATGDKAAVMRAGNINQNLTNIDTWVEQIRTKETPGRSIFPNFQNLTANDVKMWAKPDPASSHMANISSLLQNIVNNVVSLLTDLQSAYENRLTEDQQYNIRQQLYFGQDNISTLVGVQRDFPRAGQTGQ